MSGYENRILSSQQAGGLMHKIENVIERGDWTFMVAKEAELPEIVQYADFR